MTETFTQNDVIRYLYNETSPAEKQQIKSALRWDNDLAEFYHEMRQLTSQMNEIVMEPSQRSVDAIMAHAKHDNLQIVSK